MKLVMLRIDMKIGIKCEIHSCTISFMKNFLYKYFEEEEIILINKSKKARNDTQYYSDRNISDKLYQQITNNASSFLVKCKDVLNGLDETSIKEIRDKLRDYN